MRVLVVAVAAVAFVVGGAFSMGGCSSASSSSAGAATTTCTTGDGMTCPTGAGVLQLCVTGSGQCTGAYFTVGSQTINCDSCTDTTACQEQAYALCYGDAGSGSSSGSSSGGSSGGADAAVE